MKLKNVLLAIIVLITIFKIGNFEEINILEERKLIVNDFWKNMFKYAQSQKKNKSFIDLTRFKSKEKENFKNRADTNPFIMNTEVISGKIKLNSEVEIEPAQANASSSFVRDAWGISFENYEANNSIEKYKGFLRLPWMSHKTFGKNNKNAYSWIEYTFNDLTKIDSINIDWYALPRYFQVSFKVRINGTYIPITEKYLKRTLKAGKDCNLSEVSKIDSLIFNKSIFALVVKIEMWGTMNTEYFGIDETKFYTSTSKIVIANQKLNTCINLCMYVNSNKPREGSSVEAIDCLKAMQAADNREVFVIGTNKQLKTINGDKCIGFDDKSSKVIIKNECGGFLVKTEENEGLSFNDNTKCISIDSKNPESENFVNENTEIIASSEYDTSYKKENMAINSDHYWLSAKGIDKATVYINFGKINKSSDEWEIKMIDKIRIHWQFQPKKFKLFSWYQGSSLTLVASEDEPKMISEFILKGIKSSSILISMDEGIVNKSFNSVVFGIKEVYIGSEAYKLIVKPCTQENISQAWTMFKQMNLLIDKTEMFNKQYTDYSLAFDKVISKYNLLKNSLSNISKTKNTFTGFKDQLDNYENQIAKVQLEEIKLYNANYLNNYDNAQYTEYVKKFGLEVKDEETLDLGVGSSEDFPVENCIKIKELKKNAVSGFYWIKNNCFPNPLKMWCDFEFAGESIDIYINSGKSEQPNTDLSNWKILNDSDIGYRCAKLGLYPFRFDSVGVTKRVIELIEYLGYDLNKNKVIPFGYDYGCKKGKCNRSFKSFSSNDSKEINYFFNSDTTNSKNDVGSMAGVGFGNINILKVFDPTLTIITGIVCSSNGFALNKPKQYFSFPCNSTLESKMSNFSVGVEKLVFCEAACNSDNINVYGSGPYLSISSLCKAAIHSGKIKVSGGLVKVKVLEIAKNLSSGKTSNSITSQEITRNHLNQGYRLFEFIDFKGSCPIDQFKLEAAKENYTSFVESSSSVSNSNSNKDINLNDSEIEELKLKGIDIMKILIKKSSKEQSQRFKETDFNATGIKRKISGTNKLPKIDSSTTDRINSSINTAKNLADNLINSDNTNEMMKNVRKTVSDVSDKVIESGKDYANKTSENLEKQIPQNNFDLSKIKEEIQAEKSSLPLEDPSQDKVEQIKNPDPSVQCSPATDSGVMEIKKIFKSNYSDNFNSSVDLLKNIDTKIKTFDMEISFSQVGSTLSVETLSKKYDSLKKSFNNIKKYANQTIDKARSRKNRTEKIYLKWIKELRDLTKLNVFKSDYKRNINEMYVTRTSKLSGNIVKEPKWSKFSNGIKGRTTAIGIVGEYTPVRGLIGTSLIVKDKEVFDFTLETDILVTGSGKGKVGIIFRMKNLFSFYALVFDLSSSSKQIIKVNKGIEYPIKVINDGGIVANTWHKIVIMAQATSFKIEVTNLESSNDKFTLNFDDGAYAKGEVGVFVNNSSGVYFDGLNLNSLPCWNPWTTKKHITIISPSTNYYLENFSGIIQNKFKLVDPEEVENGPSDYVIFNQVTSSSIDSIDQQSKIADKSSLRVPSMLLKENVYYSNGIYKVGFVPKDKSGIVSIIFKYYEIKSANGEMNVQYYSFDLISLNEEKSFALRKFSIDKFEVLSEVKNSDKNLKIGFSQNVNHIVKISFNENVINISLKVENDPWTDVLSYTDKKSIKYGKIGFGTWNIRVRFNSIQTNPFSKTLTSEQISSYLTSPNDAPLSDQTIKKIEEDKKEQIGEVEIKSNEFKQNITNTSTPSKKDCSPQKVFNKVSSTEIYSCFINNSTDQTEEFCDKLGKENVGLNVNECKVNF